MSTVTKPLQELEEFIKLRQYLQTKQGTVQVSGCLDSGMVHFIHGAGDGFSKKIILTFSESKAKELYEDYKCFEENVVLYPAKDFIFYQADIHGNLFVKQRLGALHQILQEEAVTVITTLDGFMDPIMPPQRLAQAKLELAVGDRVEMEAAILKLVSMGYERVSQVEAPGQFAVRGSILDVFSLLEDLPCRIDFWDEDVDLIKLFEPESQRAVAQVEQINIGPATEYCLSKQEREQGIAAILEACRKQTEALRKNMQTEAAFKLKTVIDAVCSGLEAGLAEVALDPYINYFMSDGVTLLDYFPKEDTIIFMDEPRRMIEHGEAVEAEFRESMIHRMEQGIVLPKQAEVLFPCKQIAEAMTDYRICMLTALEQKVKEFPADVKLSISMQNMNGYQNQFALLAKDLTNYKKQKYRVVLFCASTTRGQRLAKNLQDDFSLPVFYSDDWQRDLQPGEIMITKGSIHKGFSYPDIKFVVIAETDIFGTKKRKRRKKSNYSGTQIQSFTDLHVGDYVIHENHGLGIYRGIEKIQVDKVTKDYMKIEYGDGGNLYVLATGLDLIQKYAGNDAKVPKLNKLGSADWGKTKQRVKGAVQDIAKELVELYARRQAKEGFVYSKDSVWQKEFEEMFPYAETEDQLRAVEEIKADMESTHIMDRLVCGDVGFGKTEVAMRAAFKAVQDGKQVAVLVPTTILAQQHFQTFTQRFKDYPVRVDLLCRFRTPAQQKQTLTDLKKGFVDILIGTHRLLSKDVQYKELGLLVVDEEQRFGVTHKEKIKQLKDTVDVLTLTATPIPRTMHMSLVGIRDMSVLEEAPVDRTPIQTFVMEYEDEMVRQAISRELSRNGQVYYVYNRVNNIADVAAHIQQLVPEANVAYAHGQMSERKLEQIMYDFVNEEIDVLVSTTIIETGMNIANANTIIIHDADKLGLSQLYQLRGRVGRSNRTAYAFLFYRRDRMLKEVAEKRLSAIREFTDLGAGFKIAMKDLEIRGAGNLLGQSQHGHMEAVGYDLYCKLLNEAVLSLKGEAVAEDFETTIDINLDAYIPPFYIGNEGQKLDMYKRIAAIETREDYTDMEDELVDRFGELPRQVENLLWIAMLKAKAHKAYITEVSGNRQEIRITMYEKARIDTTKIPEFMKKYGHNMKIATQTTPVFTYVLGKKNPETDLYLQTVDGIVTDLLALAEV
jgi:transcription-repair coupling factor (superfamily II helicase)